MREWCLEHPYLTFVLVAMAISSVHSILREIFRKKTDVTFTVAPEALKQPQQAKPSVIETMN